MRRCLLDDRAHLAMLRQSNVASARQKATVAGVNLRLEDFTPLLDTAGGEAALLAAHRLATYLTEAQEESSMGIVGIEPELVSLAIERLEYYVEHNACHDSDSIETVKSGELSHQILSAILSIFTAICANSNTMILARIFSPGDAIEKSLAQQLDDGNSLIIRLIRAAQSLIRYSNLRLYEPVTMALRLIGNLASHGLCIACYLFDARIVDSICALMNTGLYNCFASIRAEVQWAFTAIASHFPNDQGGDGLVTRLDRPVSADSLSRTYLDVALCLSADHIVSSLQSRNTYNDSKLYDRWYLSLCWLMYSFMCPCLVSRDSISNSSILELIVKSISVTMPDISSIAMAALNQYSMSVPTDTKKITLFTNQMTTFLRHSFASIFSTYIDACVHGTVDPYYTSILKEALIFLNNENSEGEMPGFWIQSIASLYAKLLRANRNLATDTIDILELLTEALGSTVSICSNETMDLLCSSNSQIFAQLIKILKSYLHKPCAQTRHMIWKHSSILLNVSELLRTMIDYVPEADLKFYKQDLLNTINTLLVEDIDVQVANILEELRQCLSNENE